MANDILLFGIPVKTTESETVNMCLLIMRQYIHVSRCKKVLPNIRTCIRVELMSINMYSTSGALKTTARWELIEHLNI